MTPNFRPPVSVGPLGLALVAVNATEDEVQTAALNAAVQVYGELRHQISCASTLPGRDLRRPPGPQPSGRAPQRSASTPPRSRQ